MRKIKEIIRRMYKQTIWKWMPQSVRDKRNRSGYPPDIAEKVKDAETYILSHLDIYEDSSTIKYIKKYGLSYVFNDNFVARHIGEKIPKIVFDEKVGLYYLLYREGKMYFTKSFISRKRIESYFASIMLEQDINSPHCYHADKDINEDTILIDAGGAEGFFSLDYVKTVKKIIIIECDEGWVSALKETFKPYADKVTIIKKFLSDRDDENNVTIDTIIREADLTTENVFVKMDLEGGEYVALCGAKECFGENIKINMAVTVYHNVWDERKIRELLEGYPCKIECSKGYMFFAPQSGRFEEPYLTHGVLKISL